MVHICRSSARHKVKIVCEEKLAAHHPLRYHSTTQNPSA